ncbi:MAG: ArsR/SmtB family transcription factor [Promethearchaeota archaeon]
MMVTDDPYELQSEICKVLSNPKRIQIIDLLKNGEMTVTDIAKALDISQSNASQHLIQMKAKGVVKSRRDGRQIFYGIAVPEIPKACELVRNALKRMREKV